MGGLEEKGFGFGREDVCRYRGKKKIVLTSFTWFVKLDRCQNFKYEI